MSIAGVELYNEYATSRFLFAIASLSIWTSILVVSQSVLHKRTPVTRCYHIVMVDLGGGEDDNDGEQSPTTDSNVLWGIVIGTAKQGSK